MPAATAPKTLGEALLKVQAEAPKLQKDSINPHFGNKYIGLDSLLPQILPLLQKYGLLLSQVMDNVGGSPSLRTQLTHVATGESLVGNCPLEVDRKGAQAVGSAVTYYRRYGLMSVLGLVADADDDGAAASKPAAPAVPAQPTELLGPGATPVGTFNPASLGGAVTI